MLTDRFLLQCRIVVRQMSDSRCQLVNSFVLLAALCFVGVFLSQKPSVEIAILWLFVVSTTLAHLHYGMVVVR